MPVRRVHLVISGLVQGVSYRASTRDVARRLGLVGWVRNLPNGDVEALAEGAAAHVEQLVAWCHQGPEEARVRAVAVKEVAGDDSFSDFQVRR